MKGYPICTFKTIGSNEEKYWFSVSNFKDELFYTRSVREMLTKYEHCDTIREVFSILENDFPVFDTKYHGMLVARIVK